MPRKGHTQKREILADPMYGSIVVTKLVNNIMLDGKKGVARRSFTEHSIRLLKKQEKMLSKYSKKL